MIGTTTDNMVMPVTPFGGYGNSSAGFGGDWSMWLILIIIFLGWGGNGFGGGFGGNNQLSYDFPWLLNGQNNINANTNNGFRDAMINDGINGIQNSINSGFGNVQTALCGGFAGVNASVTGAQNALSQQLYTNQIADMNQRFTDTLAQTNQMNSLAASLQNCCCENRSSIADLKYAVGSEGCADRNALNMATRDLLTNNTSNTQAVLDAIRGISDKLCDQELQAERRTNDNLRQQLAMAQLQASQTSQTAMIEQYVRPNPMPAYIVSNPYYPSTGNGTTT